MAHWIWGGGWLSSANWLTESGVMDFAGGLVVHVTAGVSALVAALMIKPRTGFPSDVSPPHSPGLTMIGASMLWWSCSMHSRPARPPALVNHERGRVRALDFEAQRTP